MKITAFTLDKSNIRPDAALELDKIVEVMNEYADMGSGLYTDCRASKTYNEILSDRRAKSSASNLESLNLNVSTERDTENRN